ncbi:MAG TPA: PhaM family polyhydroxyalkanoate granule multifunctional regulatory protein [Limnobacter sp.]|uniref:PhaM family polyhydroxyalkanoate granule multifunctional regulatory protein n=1 Tax=Limnobacter sp. TaxID=2003368 RepID=UPI002ED873F6
MSNRRIPNLSVTDGFDFVKKIWGSLPIPSVMSPTTDLDELDKRISDLKAVEQWLNVNLSMLRATIQGLEVQRGTIATIKSFGSNLGLGDRSSEVNQAVNEELIRNAMQAAAVSPTVPPVPKAKPIEPKLPDPEPEAVSESSKAIISNATAWWGLLQEQFNKVATAAMSGSGLNEVDKSAAAAPATAKAADASTASSSKKPANSASTKPRRSSSSSKKTTSSTTRRTRSRS